METINLHIHLMNLLGSEKLLITRNWFDLKFIGVAIFLSIITIFRRVEICQKWGEPQKNCNRNKHCFKW